MAFRTIANAVSGSLGNTTALRVTAGPHFFVQSASVWTGVTSKLQYSSDNVTFYDIPNTTASAAALNTAVTLPDGWVRANITGGNGSSLVSIIFESTPFSFLIRDQQSTITRVDN